MAASKHPMYHWVGLAIRDIRMGLIARDATFTQEHVAHEAEVSLRHYQKIEAGAIDVRLSTLYRISIVLEQQPQFVLEKAELMAQADSSKAGRRR